jgi:hypothetical protein
MEGSFSRGLKRIGLPGVLPHEGDVSLSVNELETHLKQIKGHQPRPSDEEWGDTADLVLDVHPKCQNKALWHFMVKSEMEGIDEVPEEFSEFLDSQRRKRE